MPRAPHVIGEDALMALTASAALAAYVIAFVAYVGTWITARRLSRRTKAETELPGAPRQHAVS